MILDMFYHSGFCPLNLAHHGSLVVAMPASKGILLQGMEWRTFAVYQFLVQSAVSGN